MPVEMLRRIDRLCREGEYLQAMQFLRGHRADLPSGDGSILPQVLRAELLQRTGDSIEAERVALALVARQDLSPELRSRCHSVVGACRREAGDLIAAIAELQRAVQHAYASQDRELACWAKLRLLLARADGEGADAASCSLPDLRREVLAAGDHQLAAALNLAASQLEARRGLMGAARRHITLAQSLLRRDPNSWLENMALVDSACVEYLCSNFREAERCAADALEQARLRGQAAIEKAALINLGHAYLGRGEFGRADRCLRAALGKTVPGSEGHASVLDGLAQVMLAKGELAGCRALLSEVSTNMRRPNASANYYTGWIGLTRARLLLAEARWTDAVAECRALLSSEAGGDPVLAVHVRFAMSEGLSRLGDVTNAVRAIACATRGAVDWTPRLVAAACRATGAWCFAAGLRREGVQCYRRALLMLDSIACASERVQVERELSDWRGELRADGGDWSGHDSDNSRREHFALPESATRPVLMAIAGLLSGCDDLAVVGRLVFEVLVHGQIVESATMNARREDGSVQVLARFNASQGHAGNRDIELVVDIQLGKQKGVEYFLAATLHEHASAVVAVAAVKRLIECVHTLSKARREERERGALWPVEEMPGEGRGVFVSQVMQDLVATARKAANTTLNVLITGETGTGKEVLARVLHDASPQAKGPFLAFNCSAVPRDMLDSQLFGHRRGAFTGAVEAFEGVIRAAKGGTLFLDEIGELTPEVQPKLLRFLESGEIQPLGDARPTQCKVRVVAATNADLDQGVANGRFREDLYYRLNGIHLKVPPLRERREEIPVLVQHFLDQVRADTRREGVRVAEETMEYLLLYRWPGNVRQLANEIRRMASMAESHSVLMPEHLSPEIAATRRTVAANERPLAPTEVVVRLDQPLSAAFEHIERAMIPYAMRAAGERLEDAARVLGLSRKGLYLKRQRLGMEPAGRG